MRAGSATYAVAYGIVVVIVPTVTFVLFENPARRLIRAWLGADRTNEQRPRSLRPARTYVASRRRAILGIATPSTPVDRSEQGASPPAP
jgi:peptidoglycan/LPS O-acetylase OafA/YrhL